MNRIVIFIEQTENRRLLTEWLGRYYDVTVGESVVQAKHAVPLLNEPFDLCILDGPALHHLWEWVQARKNAEQPVFLPVLLITLQPDIRLVTRHLWQTVDELISKPIEKLELQARVEILLRSRRLSLQLQAALEQERELKQIKTRFVSMVSHEFRNPLNIIFGFSRLLEKSDLSPERRADFAQRIHIAVRTMTALLDDVLALGKAEAIGATANMTLIVIEPFCRKLVEEIKFGMGANHTIQFDCAAECLSVHVNEVLLRQVLTNLLSNAIKYSPPQSTVRLRLQCESAAVIIQVQDEGIGISPTDQAHLFESFFRASNVGNISGTGLGLAIVKQVIEQSGGTISVASEVNVGTTFTVTLPINQ
ncbi:MULTISPECIES: hybrid sensor histidine kinase/response regulator [Leptolyngbya]|uniref:hybrid sensor histidine kinase/response regulator n=1 Tax=Leptolyngbya TaxID=47251 RepID=UPI0016820F0A|nr:ATP-binding protein [Leptolyngbya sp. FACHB-1624]MBD1856291.1 hybrid sensor histidine kinase/response regulator [Leptolyngbya sp. FACHB-1624]